MNNKPFQFVEPPAIKKGRCGVGVIEPIRLFGYSNPGKWFLAVENSASITVSGRRLNSGVVGGEFEVTSRTKSTRPKLIDIYVRFNQGGDS